MMQFIKTTNDFYLNTTQIISLYLDAHNAQNVAILASTDKGSEILICDNFPDEDAAQRYLRRIISALNNTEIKIIEVKDYEAD